MTRRFDKDKWIKHAILKGYIKPNVDGTILRCVSADKKGNLLSDHYEPVKYQTHKKTGRVYFNMTWMGFTKSVLVNRAIALAFLPNPNNLPQVNHCDGDKQHNYLRQPTPELIAKYGEFQLEWSSASDNEKHAHANGLKSGRGTANANSKLTPEKVEAIRQSRDKPIMELVAEFGVARSTIANILKGKTWSHV